MSLSVSIAVYFLIWWLVLFAILPFGIRSQHEEPGMASGTDPGAPVRPRLLGKAMVTTIISGVLFGAGYWALASGLLRLEDFPMPFTILKH